MGKSIISQGKTTSEAIQKGLNELRLSKKDVDIKVLEADNKKSFFDILAPRIVKVELTVRDEIEKETSIQKNNINNNSDKNNYEEHLINDNEFAIIKNNLEQFLKEFFKNIKLENIEYKIINEIKSVKVDIKGENLNSLIGYRGETLNALQTLISRIGNKGLENRCRIILDIAGYREKRIKVLEDLAIKVSKTVEKNRKSITLEPMSAFERKIIHNKLQSNLKITTRSIGNEPNRKIVIEMK